MPGRDLAHSQDNVNAHCAHARRHFFAWRGPHDEKASSEDQFDKGLHRFHLSVRKKYDIVLSNDK